MSIPVLDSAATMDANGAYFSIQHSNMEQNILSHPNMSLLYRGDDGYTDDSASDDDSMPGLVNDSDDEDNDEEADVVQQQYDANDILTGNVHNNSDTFDEEAMCKFMDELRVAETDITELDYIEECPTCGLFRYPDDPKHIDICHLHVYCTVCNRFEGVMVYLLWMSLYYNLSPILLIRNKLML